MFQVGKKPSKPDFTDDLIAVPSEEGESPHDCVLARWPDGSEHIVAELLRSDLIEMQNAKVASARVVHPTLWEGKDQDGMVVVVKGRTDRNLLVSIYKGKHQICQVSTARCTLEEHLSHNV